jgi:hypothetical protein
MTAPAYDEILTEIVATLNEARSAAARTVNTVMTATYWQIGHRIVEHEQRGRDRAEYGQALLRRLATDLTARFGRGFGMQNLYQMRQFRPIWPPEKIFQTVSGRSDPAELTSGPRVALGPASTLRVVDPVVLVKLFPLPCRPTYG